MTQDELDATDFLIATHIDGHPATPSELAAALAVLARNRPFGAFGRLAYAAMLARHLHNLEVKID